MASRITTDTVRSMTTASSTSALGDVQSGLQRIVNELARDAGAAGTPRVELTRPSDEKFGDYATNVALMLAGVVRDNPRSVAQKIADQAASLPGVASIDVAGPGFINLTLESGWYIDTLGAVMSAGASWGNSEPAVRERVLLEFVSANPTGPLVAASARHAAYGDSLARICTAAGYELATEFYVNDAGRQVNLFGQSILARATGSDVPEGGYQGDYIADLARDLGAAEGDDPAELGARGVTQMVASMQPVLESFRVHFDRFQLESELHESQIIAEALELLEQHGHLYEEDGATWLRTTTFGDDKDRTVRRSNGVPTYFAADLGYLLHKYRRGYDRLIYVLGADHHGYIARLRAGAAAMGFGADSCEVIIMQLVSLLEGGEQRKMSKRRGDIVAMQELIDRVGVDAARFFMMQRSNDQTLDLDLELAAQDTDANPVFYVQYAHARACSVMRKVAEERGITPPDAESLHDLLSAGAELHPSERRLIKRMAELPVVVAEAAERRAPHKLTHYAHDVAHDFSAFYRDCRVLGEGVSEESTRLRLALCSAVRTVLARSLDLVGVSAPERM